ncbi:MAG: hypothetical protein DME62_02145 [Verrucomicrobia bacterium]|nr:MAG: hypothetical protein DME62_02145 [Verrucomicrobiota bacterium]
MHHPIKPKKPDMGLNRENAESLMKLFGRYSNISYVLWFRVEREGRLKGRRKMAVFTTIWCFKSMAVMYNRAL